VLANRQATVVPGMEWAWLLPDARLATLLPEDAAGHRVVSGSRFFVGPNEALVHLGSAGELVLAADGKRHSLGAFSFAGFDAKGASVLVSNTKDWALFSRSGQRIMGDLLHTNNPLLLPSGLIIERRGAWTRLVRPPSTVLLNQRLQCPHVFAEANRLVCFDTSGSLGPATSVFSLDTGERLAVIVEPPKLRGMPGFAVSKDGSKLAIVRDEAKIVELRSGKIATRTRVIGRGLPHSRYSMPGRIAFTTDDAHLCFETGEYRRVIKTASPGGSLPGGKGRQPLCALTQRLPLPVLIRENMDPGDWEAALLDAPLHEGFTPVPRSPHQALDVVTATADRKIAAFLEQKPTPTANGTLWTAQAVVFDAVSKTELQVIRVGAEVLKSGLGADVQSVELSPDGSLVRVCSVILPSGLCNTYEVSTGATSPRVFKAQRGQSLSDMQIWSGPAPETRVADVASVLPPKGAKGPEVIAWRDEGAYLSVEIGLGGGVSQRLNVKDTEARVARDVVAVAGGRLLAIASQGSVLLWAVQPLELRALLVAVETGIVALFPDGTFEAIGDAESAVRCQQGDTIVPVAECGELRAPTGTFGRLIKEASR